MPAEEPIAASLALLQGSWGVGFAFLFGAIWGSFYNVCIHRLPAGESVVRPRSRCPRCRTPIRARDNLPIVSYVLLRGRCRACGARFSVRYAVVEALTAVIAAVLWARVVGDGDGAIGLRLGRFGADFAFSGVLIVLAGIDLDTLLLPDVLTLPAIPVFLALGIGLHGTGWRDALIGAAAGFAFIWLIVLGYRYLAGREGMGEGDAKLLAGIGAFLGASALPLVVFVASVVGATTGIVALFLGRTLDPEAHGQAPAPPLRMAKVPFGPFLALGAVAYLFVGPLVMRALVGLYLGG